MAITTINPATGDTLATYQEMSSAKVQRILEHSCRAFFSWRECSFSERGKAFQRLAKRLRDRANELAELMALEMGKPVRQGRAEVEKCSWTCEYFAEQASEMLAPQRIQTEASSSYVTFLPLGGILAVMPWNFPLWQVFRCAAPALMAGNAFLLKHASNVTGCALRIEELFQEAAFPEGVFRTLVISHAKALALIEHPAVAAVALTGSGPAGRAIAAKAGSMLKKTVLELGGSDPYLILEDADLEVAAKACLQGRMINAGQSCIAAKRLIVVEAVRKSFEERFVREMEAQSMGDPLEEETLLGPLARFDLREQLHRQVSTSIEKGARCLTGGFIPEGNGAYYPPTVLTDVDKGMPAFDEETFGPVAAIVPVKSEEQAIAKSVDTPFGLGAAVFTRDIARGERIASGKLEAGCCFVNDFVRSDPRLPFGGIKESGYGRELSAFGIKEFVNIKTVYIK